MARPSVFSESPVVDLVAKLLAAKRLAKASGRWPQGFSRKASARDASQRGNSRTVQPARTAVPTGLVARPSPDRKPVVDLAAKLPAAKLLAAELLAAELLAAKLAVRNFGARTSSAREQFTPVGLGIVWTESKLREATGCRALRSELFAQSFSLQSFSLQSFSLQSSQYGNRRHPFASETCGQPTSATHVLPNAFTRLWLKPAPEVLYDQLFWQLTERVGAPFAAANKPLFNCSLDSGLAVALRNARPPTSLCSAARSARAWLRHFGNALVRGARPKLCSRPLPLPGPSQVVSRSPATGGTSPNGGRSGLLRSSLASVSALAADAQHTEPAVARSMREPLPRLVAGFSRPAHGRPSGVRRCAPPRTSTCPPDAEGRVRSFGAARHTARPPGADCGAGAT